MQTGSNWEVALVVICILNQIQSVKMVILFYFVWGGYF